MMLEIARMEDLEAICALYESTCAQMQAAGLNQWSWGEYPSRDIVREDLEAGRLYVARQGGAPICAVAIDREQEEQYARVDWLFGTRPGSFHRFAVAGELRGQGLGRKVLGEIIQILQGMGCDSLRCDTSAENAAALHLYESQGMRRAGAVHYPPDLSQDYPCLEMPLAADCPLLPIPMTPAFRGGSLTPWGGKKLREVYGKEIPNDTTGESLEVSCIPGLESADPMGVKLPELIARYGEKLVGAYAGETFPVTGDITVEGTVTSSDRARNFYRSLCIEDGNAAIEVMAGIDQLHNDYPAGCRVTLRLEGLAVGESRGVLQAGRLPDPGSGYATDYIGSKPALDAALIRHGETLRELEPARLRIAELTPERCGTLVRIDRLIYRPEDLSGSTWSGYKRFADDEGAEIYTYVRTYARFADEEVPAGQVSLTGILQHDETGGGRYILKLRDETDCRTL